MSEAALLIEAFRRNARVNEALLDALSPPDLILSDRAGGMSVGQHLEHLIGGRKLYLKRVGSRHAEQITVTTEEGDQAFWTVTLSLEQMRSALAEADQAVIQAVEGAENGEESFQRHFASHPAHLLTLTLVHDAGHRAQITALLRQGGWTAAKLDRLAGHIWPVWRE